MSRRAVAGHSYGAFRAEAAAFLDRHRGSETLIIAGSRGTADDMLWRVAPAGSMGAHRFTLMQAAAVLAAPTLAADGLRIANHFACEAVAARVVHELRRDQAWSYFGPVASTPGFAQALAATLGELRLNGVQAAELKKSDAPGQDLATALRVYTEQLQTGAMADLAGMFEIAIDVAHTARHRFVGLPLLLLDAEARSELARRFVSTLVEHSPSVLACTLAADQDSMRLLERLLGVTCYVEADSGQSTTLARVRSQLFKPGQAGTALDETLDFFSAPGEAMECVELARRMVRLAEGGVPFDRMAVLLRAPDRYQPLLEEALRRANVPAHFSRGVVRPDPAGRAFLALLACALENCSASRFAEYLSLGQVPSPGQPAQETLLADDEIHVALRGAGATETLPPVEEDEAASDTDPVIAGTLQPPSHWEHLLIDASVIGGADRWERRLNALGNELRLKLERSEGNPGDQEHYERELARLGHLQEFALPLIHRLGRLPGSAPWGTWLELLQELARLSLRRPGSVLAVLSELEPMADIGPVGLEEVALVLSDRLRFLRREPPLRTGGRVFVAGIEEARGRVFDAIFLPGLAEGIFPRRVTEDPLLLDVYRQNLSGALHTNHQRREQERLLLSIAAAAAARQFTFSYPRIDLAQSRPRVPSFYALEVIRAAHGYLPELRSFQEQAARRAPSRLDRPAPVEFADAIDDTEYDLVALDRALSSKGKQRLGAMAYLTQVSETLGRSLRARYSRWEIKTKWTEYDGLVQGDADLGPALRAHRLSERAYSPTTLQAFAACPYRFALLGILRLRPRDTIQPLHQMDPLTRGALFHDVQREFFQRAIEANLLPIGAGTLQRCREILDGALTDMAARYADKLAPAIARVWSAEVEDVRTDLHGWLQHIAADSEWLPQHYELAFGLPDLTERDPASDAEPVTLDNGVQLRGAIDLVERHATRGVLRVVDHKTGRAPQQHSSIVGGGVSLQPMLYALAAGQRLGAPVESGRLFYCTQRGNYQIVDVPVTVDSRLRIGRVLDIIDAAIGSANLPAAPNRDACDNCDCRCVCGPHEQTRWHRKTVRLQQLDELRNMP